MSRFQRLAAAAALARVMVGCAEDEPAGRTCGATDAGTDCTPSYEATFSEIHTRRLGPGCATGSVCHDAEGAKGGLDLSTPEAAWEGLVGEERVEPGNPACGVLIERLTTTDASERMPPGGTLPEGELCAIRRWIAAGAGR